MDPTEFREDMMDKIEETRKSLMYLALLNKTRKFQEGKEKTISRKLNRVKAAIIFLQGYYD